MNSGQRGPWGPWDGGYSSQEGTKKQTSGKSAEKNRSQTKTSSGFFEEFTKKINDFFKENFGGNGGSEYDDQPSFFHKTSKSTIGLFIIGAILLWLSLGLYKVNPNENAVTLYFGKFYSVTTPGLNYHIPYPFGKVIKKSVTAVNIEEFGFSSNGSKYDKRNFDAESLMLTGDENIVDIEFQVQWQIADIKDFIFNIAEPNQSIRKSAESAMREIIARTPIVSALSDGKLKIEQEAKDLLQQILNSYGAGVRVVLVQLRRVDPPQQVIDAFRDVQTAKADKEKEINQAEAYSNDIIPRSRGAAAQIVEQSEAYAKEVVANAQGEGGRFMAVYNQYQKAKQITKKRIYLETMEEIYRDMDKVFIDKSAAKSSVLPYFPLNEIQQNKK